MKHLLKVEDTFKIPGQGLVVAPEIPIPSRFTNFTDTIVVAPPNSNPFEAIAHFFLSHSTPGGFKLFITLPFVQKKSLPIGSCILVSESTHSRLLSGTSQ